MKTTYGWNGGGNGWLKRFFRVCRAASGTSMDTSSTLVTPGPGGVPRPHGTEAWATTMRLSAASQQLYSVAFLFVASQDTR